MENELIISVQDIDDGRKTKKERRIEKKNLRREKRENQQKINHQKQIQQNEEKKIEKEQKERREKMIQRIKERRMKKKLESPIKKNNNQLSSGSSKKTEVKVEIKPLILDEDIIHFQTKFIKNQKDHFIQPGTPLQSSLHQGILFHSFKEEIENDFLEKILSNYLHSTKQTRDPDALLKEKIRLYPTFTELIDYDWKKRFGYESFVLEKRREKEIKSIFEKIYRFIAQYPSGTEPCTHLLEKIKENHFLEESRKKYYEKIFEQSLPLRPEHLHELNHVMTQYENHLLFEDMIYHKRNSRFHPNIAFELISVPKEEKDSFKKMIINHIFPQKEKIFLCGSMKENEKIYKSPNLIHHPLSFSSCTAPLSPHLSHLPIQQYLQYMYQQKSSTPLPILYSLSTPPSFEKENENLELLGVIDIPYSVVLYRKKSPFFLHTHQYIYLFKQKDSEIWFTYDSNGYQMNEKMIFSDKTFQQYSLQSLYHYSKQVIPIYFYQYKEDLKYYFVSYNDSLHEEKKDLIPYSIEERFENSRPIYYLIERK